jgi:hypothetical protein
LGESRWLRAGITTGSEVVGFATMTLAEEDMSRDALRRLALGARTLVESSQEVSRAFAVVELEGRVKRKDRGESIMMAGGAWVVCPDVRG